MNVHHHHYDDDDDDDFGPPFACYCFFFFFFFKNSYIIQSHTDKKTDIPFASTYCRRIQGATMRQGEASSSSHTVEYAVYKSIQSLDQFNEVWQLYAG